MEPKLIEGMSFADYVASPALNFSSLKWMDDCPATFRSMFLEPEDPEERPASTDDQVFGRAYHHYILENKTFSSEFYPTTKIARRGAPWDEVLKIAGGLQVIWDEDLETIVAMAAALGQHELCPGIFRGSKRELSIFWEQDGVPCKARVDLLNSKLGIFADLKSTRSAAPKFFLKEIIDRRYDAQLAWYREALRAVGFDKLSPMLIAQGKTNGHQVMVYELTAELLDVAALDNAARLKKYKICKERDEWPGYPSIVYKVTLPEWKAKEVFGGNV